MKDQYTIDRRDPVVKKLEREGLNELLKKLGTSQRIVAGVVLAMVLSQAPANAFTRKDFYDAARRWEHGSFCQGLFRSGWETVSFFFGC